MTAAALTTAHWVLLAVSDVLLVVVFVMRIVYPRRRGGEGPDRAPHTPGWTALWAVMGAAAPTTFGILTIAGVDLADRLYWTLVATSFAYAVVVTTSIAAARRRRRTPAPPTG